MRHENLLATRIDARGVMTHPLPHWVERMTVNYVQAHGGGAERHGRAWDLTWPDGEREGNVVFSARDADRSPSARHLTLETPRVRELATRIPPFAPGQPIPCLALQGLPAEVRGLWSLWRIILHEADDNRHRVMPLFRHEDGRVLAPTARFVWDQMLADQLPICSQVQGRSGALPPGKHSAWDV